jgi:hypothetical protein
MPFERRRTRKTLFWIFILFLALLISVAYLLSLDLKRTVLAKLSEKATSTIKQRVHIQDLSINLPGTINLYHLTIENPDDFTPGELLRIRRLRLDIRPIELLKGVFSLRNIVLYEPELTLRRDEKGRWNISDGLKRYFSEESSTKYQVDEFRIESGFFNIDKDEKYHIDSINLRLKNLSSDPDTKTGIMGKIRYAGNEIEIDGSAYLNDTAKKVNLSISSKDFLLSPLKKNLNTYWIDTEKTRIDMSFHIEGDKERGFYLTSNLRLKRIGTPLLTKGLEDVRLQADGLFIPQEDSLIVNSASLYADGFSAATLRGWVKDLGKDPSYRGEMKVDRLDLSKLNFFKDVKLKGILSSNRLSIRGRFRSKGPEVSGSFRLREGGMESHQALVEKIEADIIFSSNQEMNFQGEGLAKVVQVGSSPFSKPVEVKLSTTLHGTPQRMEVLSVLKISSLEMKFEKGGTLSLSKGNVMIEGTLKDQRFSGKNLLEMEGLRLAGHSFPRFKSGSNMDYHKDEINLRNLTVEMEGLKSSVDLARINLSQMQAGFNAEIRGINLAYPNQGAFIKEGDLLLALSSGKEAVSYDFIFSVKNILWKEIALSHVSGNGKFDDKNFSVEIAGAEIAGGKIRATTKGMTSEGLFPIKATFLAERVDLTTLSNFISKTTNLKLPYRIAGAMKKASFEGTIHSQESLNGNASFEADNLSVSTASPVRTLVKNAFLRADVEFMEKDLTFKAEAETGKLSTRLSGIVKGFIGNERHLQVKGTLAEVKVSDIRDTFWDIFPDSLLYVGMQGSISSDVSAEYGKAGLDIDGNLLIKDFILEGENREYSIGPINGTIPIRYGKSQRSKEVVSFPSFEKSQFDYLSHYYEKETAQKDLHRLTIGSLKYGFPLLENINLFFDQKGKIWDIERLSANIFGGNLNGSARIDLSAGVDYKAGILIKGVSLERLCNGIEPIKGFISGKVDGIASFRSSGFDISHLIGMVDLWTYSAKNEKTMISKEFLQKVGGPSLKAYLKDRPFNKGVLGLYLKDGYLIFRDLEISNRNFLGITDLSIKVAPVSNRIAVDHLLWTVAEAAERAKKK